MFLIIRTDSPNAEIGLFNAQEMMAYEVWPAHRQLAETIHQKIGAMLQQNNLDLHDVTGIAVFTGPGSFTGLRIGITVANTLAAGLSVPIVGANTENWTAIAMEALLRGANEQVVIPEYGADVHTTIQKK